MATMNVSASIFISGCPLMKLEMGSMKIIMRNTASMTAMIMMMRWSAMPTAVMTESMENTRSMTMMVPTACGSAMQMERLVLLAVLGLELGELERVAQLGDALVDKVAAADEQHEVAHREPVGVGPEVDGEQRRGHMHEDTTRSTGRRCAWRARRPGRAFGRCAACPRAGGSW